MKKLCFVSFNAYPLFNPICKTTFGGSEVQLYHLGKKLSKSKDCHVSFIVNDFGQTDVEIRGNIKTVKAYHLKKKQIKILTGISYYLELFKNLAHINAEVYIQANASIETGIIAFFCKIYHKKFFYMAEHEIDCNGEYIKKNGIAGKIFQYGLTHATRVIAQNQEQKHLLYQNYHIIAPIIRNGFIIPPINNKPREYVLWVARLVEWKNPEIFITLSSHFSKEKFIMIGSPTEITYSTKVKQLATKHKNICFIPGLDYLKTEKYFLKAKIFINTSKYEGFPNTFAQSLAAGTPIVSLKVNPERYLEKYRCGFCANGNFDKLVFHVSNLLSNKNLWGEMSNNAYNYAKQNNNVDVNVKKLMKIIYEA